MESNDAFIILTYAVILEMATQLGFQDLPPIFGFDLISYCLKPRVHRFAFGDVFLATGFTANLKVALP